MSLKHIKLFESFNEDSLIEQVYESWKNDYYEILIEQESDEEFYAYNREKTKGEKAAETRGNQVLSLCQLAGAYLRAKGIYEENKDKFVPLISNTKDANLDINNFAEGERKWSTAALADALGYDSVYTLQRTISKFKNLFDGVGGTESEVMYQKLQDAFDRFKNTEIHQIGQIAGECLQPSTSTANRDAAEAALSKAADKRLTSKETAEQIGRNVYTLTKSLKKHFPLEKALRAAISKISTEFNIEQFKVQKHYEKYLKDFDLPKL